jgi:hypothetical protein
MESCLSLVQLGVPRRSANALNIEVGMPVPRCLFKQPAEWRGRGASALRWIGSGGSALVFGPCTPNARPFEGPVR